LIEQKRSLILEENIKLHKSEAYFYEVIHPFTFNVIRQTRLRNEAIRLRKIFNKGDCLVAVDIGSGTGNFAKHLERAGFEVVACELSKDMLKNNNALHRILCDATFLPLKNNCASAVVAYSVFHHLPNPLQTLNEVCRIASYHSALCFYERSRDSVLPSRKKLLLLLSYFIWLLSKPSYFMRFFEYLFYGRKAHLSYIRHIDFCLTDGSLVNMERFRRSLVDKEFDVSLFSELGTTILRAYR